MILVALGMLCLDKSDRTLLTPVFGSNAQTLITQELTSTIGWRQQ